MLRRLKMTKFKLINLAEPDLIFGEHREDKDPRIGLKNFGPFKFSSETELSDKIKIGLIGDKGTIEKAKEIIQVLTKPIDSQESNKWLFPSFVGLSTDTKFNCSIELTNSWQQTITMSEIERLVKILDVNERIGATVELYLKKINNILSEDSLPDVILCCIPKTIELYCGISEKTRGAKTPKRTKLEKQIEKFKKLNQTFLTDWGLTTVLPKAKKIRGFDLRNALKGKIMSLTSTRPIQLLRESTIDAILSYNPNKKSSRQDPASFAWNLSTALYYKANGKPWRLAKLRNDTCYVGISFYRDKLSYNQDMQTSMAQVFTHTGEGLVLRGTEVYIDEKSKEAHLTEKQAEELLLDAIKKYKERANRNPSRVVIHKKTSYTDSEKNGFKKAIGNLSTDFVTILRRNKGLRFMRSGSYPILRGTLITLSEKEHLLYTSGYTPRIRTYPGHRIPQPLFLQHVVCKRLERGKP